MATVYSLPYLYETDVEWIGERKGDLESPGLASLQVASPPEFQGHQGMWTPEHYFVASVNSCFMTTFLAIAEMSRLELVSFDSKATGKLDKVEGAGYQMTEELSSSQNSSFDTKRTWNGPAESWKKQKGTV